MFPHAHFNGAYYNPAYFPPALGGPSPAVEVELGTRVRHQLRRPQPIRVEEPALVSPPAPVEPKLPAVIRTLRLATPPAEPAAEPSPITIEDSGPVRAAIDPRRARIARSNAEIMLLFS